MRLECQLFGLFFREGEVTKAAFDVADSFRVGACDALIKKHDLESDRLKHFLADGLFDAFQSCQLQGVNPLTEWQRSLRCGLTGLGLFH